MASRHQIAAANMIKKRDAGPGRGPLHVKLPSGAPVRKPNGAQNAAKAVLARKKQNRHIQGM